MGRSNSFSYVILHSGSFNYKVDNPERRSLGLRHSRIICIHRHGDHTFSYVIILLSGVCGFQNPEDRSSLPVELRHPSMHYSVFMGMATNKLSYAILLFGSSMLSFQVETKRISVRV